ncbi:sarcinarray family MAST domain-containing protein [Methanosarcina sp. MSH10X1]|uniref:sarcinarray family MAST domain-containing protein n=1 Tax=Methanosarcina sp. MSH10X1 TaxID=2507075 RepID=UPI000FFB649D|nr:sarcinarray family MAST domain-containing protein [Methanosarcina sp. MSH10X1]RXA20085.1 sarcinarray family MAST domain-containing protein [Methanosarcina sp. MSH10X1]
MKVKYLIIISLLIATISLANASNPYGKLYTYDVYYNDNLLPGVEVAKPLLKIGEPFNLKINMTVYQEYKVSGQLTTLGEGYFEVIEGPSKMDKYSSTILKANESHVFEWTVIPTDKWAGGSIPINFHYSIVEKGNPEPVVNSEFTVAYCTISNEYYEGETPASENSESQPTPEQPTSENSAPVASAPAFSLVTAIVALALVSLRFFHQ